MTSKVENVKDYKILQTLLTLKQPLTKDYKYY